MSKKFERILPYSTIEELWHTYDDFEDFACAIEQAVLQSPEIQALLAERDALRDALETMVVMVEMDGFGRNYAMDVARAALAQEQGGSDDA